MRKLISLFLLVIFPIYAEDDVRLAAESEPMLTAADCVNLMDGSFYQVNQDFVVEGPMPLTYTRYYDSGDENPDFLKNNHYGFGVSLGYPLGLDCKMDKYGYDSLTIDQRQRFGLPFVCYENGNTIKAFISSSIYKSGYTNCTSALERGQPSLVHTEAVLCGEANINDKWEVKDADGTKRTYIYSCSVNEKPYQTFRYLLRREDHPNGLSTHYNYHGGCLVGISLKNSIDHEELSSISITFNNHEASYIVSGSDGRSVKYQQSQMRKDKSVTTPFLTSVIGEQHPQVDYEYCLKKGKKVRPLLRKISTSNGGYLEAGYNSISGVEELYAPLKGKGSHVRAYAFEYKKNKTKVIDALGRDSYYLFDKRRLTTKKEAGLREISFKWNDSGQLKAKCLKAGERHLHEIIFYNYDYKGNISEKWECGNITGLDDWDLFLRTNKFRPEDPSVRIYSYHYGTNNVLLQKEDPNGLTTYYSYKPGTNLLICKRIARHGVLFSRELYTYDKNAILIEKIEDDGYECNPSDLTNVTYRLITRIQPQMDKSLWGFTKPKVKEKLYLDLNTRQEVLLKRIEKEYVRGGMLGKKRVYDADGTLAYEESYHYNDRLLLEEKHDRLGHITQYRYDDCNNIIFEELVGSGKQTHKIYDCNNRLIETKEVHEDGTVLIVSCTYDLVGNCTSVTDADGYTTKYFYDGLNRKIKEIDPYGVVSHISYDTRNNPIKITDKEGHVTTIKYNIDHHPIVIIYPDQTIEEYRYYVDGTLKNKKEKDGTSIGYTYDYLKRPLIESRYDQEGKLLTTKSYTYKGANLICEVDPEGIATNYTYDSAKRLIAKTRDGITETYAYDSLSRLSTTVKGNKVTEKIFDPLDRVIEERIEDLAGNIYRKTAFIYDIHGNVCQQQTYTDDKIIESSTFYNSCNLPVLQIDGMGNETTISYHHAPFQRITTDPLGQTTIETYNAFKKVICIEIPGLSKQDVLYSPNGHRIKQIDHIYQQGVEKGVSTVVWQHDCMGNLTSIVEQDLKKTCHTYLHGRLDTTTKPDGVILYHTYDALGKLIEQWSSNKTIWTQFTYDLNGNMLSATDKINGTSVLRTYDAHNNITSETTHTTLYYSYDDLGRVVEICFPDSTISYEYNAIDLVSITRNNKTHSYVYDLAGRLIQENTFDGTTVFNTYDDNDNLISIISPYYQQTLSYDAIGNIIESTINEEITTYTYDGLYQLTSENTTTYTYDSIHNRLSKDDHPYVNNKLHQVISDDENIYTYDPNGNRSAKNGIIYTYDALNRLTSAGEITYTYDALGRLQTRRSPTSQESFLYCKENDLGTLDNLKILGQGIAGIEQKGKLHSVIRDHRGSPSLILFEALPVATYTYTAYGETTHSGTFVSPWQFTAHRCDVDTQLLHAPKRIYDPHLGRWLTPDPLGFADGPNLYAYVHNNPLVFIDPTGLHGGWFGFFNNFFSSGSSDHKISFNETWEKGGNQSCPYNLIEEGYQNLKQGMICFMNGIHTTFDYFKEHCKHLGDMSGGINIHGVYNATQGFFQDFIEYIMNRCYIATPPVKALHEEWNKYFASAHKNIPMLMVCHSQGAALVRNALMSYPKELRDKIIVVAIAPGCYIDSSLCKQVTHYVAEGDIVTWFDPIGRYQCRKTVVSLKAHPQASYGDHSFRSKTYEAVLTQEIDNYNTKYRS